MSGIADFPRAGIEVTAGSNALLHLKEPFLVGGMEELHIRTRKFSDYFKFTVLVNNEQTNVWISRLQLTEKFEIVGTLAELASSLDRLILILFFKTVYHCLFQSYNDPPDTDTKQRLLNLAAEQCGNGSFFFPRTLYQLPQCVYITPTFIGCGLRKKLVGRGRYAAAKLVRDLNQNTFVRRICRLKDAEYIAREYKGLEELGKLQGNPGVIDLLGICIYKKLNERIFVTFHTHCPTPCLRIKDLSPQTQWRYGSELLQTVAELEIAHGDLKRANIVIDRDGHLRLIDFSFCRCPGDTGEQPRAPHLAPECYTSDNPSIETLDVWPAAGILWEIFSGSRAAREWLRSNSSKLTEEVITEHLKTEEKFSPPLKELLAHMLVIDPTKRWSRTKARDFYIENILCPSNIANTEEKLFEA